MTTGSGDIVGVGWRFPAAVSGTGGVRLVGGTDEIDSAIRMILATVPGERVMRPEFGCEMWNHVFAPLTAGTLGLIEQAVRTALDRWEPRIHLERVTATAEQRTGSVQVGVEYRVRATNDVRNLVFPFYTIPHEEGEP